MSTESPTDYTSTVIAPDTMAFTTTARPAARPTIVTIPRLAVAAIFLGALGLRFWGITFGLPYAYHVDEPTYVSAALNLGARIIGRQANPTGFSNLLLGEYVGYLIIGLATRAFRSLSDFEAAYRADPTAFLLLSRATSAVLGSLTVIAVWAMGTSLYGRLVGALSALFMAVAFLHVRDSHFGVPDVAATLFVNISVAFAIVAIKSTNSRYTYLAAAAAGFAVATKWNLWPVLIPLGLAIAYTLRRGHKRLVRHSVYSALAALACFALGFSVGGFQLLLQPRTYLAYATAELRAGESGGFGIWQIDTLPGWSFYLTTLAYGLGTLLLASALVGFAQVVFSVLKRRAYYLGAAILLFPVTYFAVMGATRHYFARYALPLIPFSAILAGLAIASWSARLLPSRPWWAAPALALAVSSLVIAQPLANDIRLDSLLGQTDTRTLAKQWIEASLPDGAKIAVDWPIHGPPLSTPDKPQLNSQKQFDVVTIAGTGLSDHPLAWYREQHFDYLITSSFISDISLTDSTRDTERKAFYATLDRELVRVAEFRPTDSADDPQFIFDEIYGPAISLWQRERPGPAIKVYALT